MLKWFAGIGSRETPEEFISIIYDISKLLIDKGYGLRSGAADGADSYFESAYNELNGNKEIYIPWRGFNKSSSDLYNQPSKASEIARKFHVKYDDLSDGAKKLMARNVQQILGKDLDNPVDFVLCWTKDGCESLKTRTRETGGTGLAISLASYLHIPVINMKNPLWKETLYSIIGEHDENN